MSVLDFVHLGSSLSLRSMSRLASAMSVHSASRFGASISMFDFLAIGSSLSMRNIARIGSSMSLLSAAALSSTLSVGSDALMCGSLSLRSYQLCGSAMSILDFVHLGSTISCRGFARLGSTLSITSVAKLSGDVALNLDSSNNRRLYLDGDSEKTYITYDSSSTPKAVQHYVNNGGTPFRALAVTGTGGTLHGVWSADVSLTLSDRRVKTDVEPIAATLRRAFSRAEPEAAAAGPADDASGRPASWVLWELRPVSFRLKTGPEAKFVKFGFIAQEP